MLVNLFSNEEQLLEYLKLTLSKDEQVLPHEIEVEGKASQRVGLVIHSLRKGEKFIWIAYVTMLGRDPAISEDRVEITQDNREGLLAELTDVTDLEELHDWIVRHDAIRQMK